jgi:hypothetical protein
VVLSTISTVLKLSTGTSCCDSNPSCNESQCYCQAFRHTDSISKVCTFLVNWWTNHAYQILETFSWHSKQNSSNSTAALHSVERHHSANPPVVHHRHIFFVHSVLASPKKRLFFFLVLVMRLIWSQPQLCTCPHLLHFPWSITWCIHLTAAAHWMWTVVSLLFLFCLFCFCSVYVRFLFSFCFVSVLFLSV